MKRQRGRGRGGGSGGSGGGGKPQQQNANRAFDSNGPEGVKVRGNAQTVFEKYQQLARDATTAGDRVLAENYLQHSEHYFRLLRALQPQRPASEILGRDQFQSGYDIDFEDEGVQAQHEAADEAAAEASLNEVEGEQPRDNRWQAREERPRDDRQRDDRARDDRPRDRFESRDRDDRPRDDRPRDDRPRDDRVRDDRPRDDRVRDDRNREAQGAQNAQLAATGQPAQGQGRRDRWRERDDRNRGERTGEERRDAREPAPVIEAQVPVAPAPVVEERPAQMLRDSEGGESHAPAFLQAPATPRPEAAASDEEAPARRPRRRRAPRTFEGGDGSPSSSETEGA
ncbi:DUF4167 domain-containing protein [Phenylobacterium sp. LjRoot225]|uniref:DUF4167 domain-containing protein n=1 Tax=Phenylobacterium sp. LjRoot225 TaxID=3342285 RepID=UPI003ED0BCED